MTNRKKRGIAAAVVVVLLLAALGTVFGLAVSDPGFASAEPEQIPAGEAIGRAARFVLQGEPFPLSEGELNGLIAAAAEEKDEGTAVRAQDLRVRLLGDQRVAASLPVQWNGLTLRVTAELEVDPEAAEKVLSARVVRASVGRLPLPVSWVCSFASDFLPEGAEAEGETVRIPAEWPLLRWEENTPLVSLEVTRLDLSETGASAALAANADGLLALLQQGGDWLAGLFG